MPIAELEWSNGQDNLFNACSARHRSGLVTRRDDPAAEPRPARQRQRRRPVREERTTSIDRVRARSLTFDQLQTVEGIATGSTAMVETKKFATYYVENYASRGQPRISRMVFKTRRPGNTNGSSCGTTCAARDQRSPHVQTAHPGGGGFLERAVLRRRACTTRSGPAPPTFPIVELSLDVSAAGALHDEPVRRGRGSVSPAPHPRMHGLTHVPGGPDPIPGLVITRHLPGVPDPGRGASRHS